MPATNATHAASHADEQHAGAAPQTRLTQLGMGGSSHPAAKGPPVAQSECAQATWLAGQVRLPQIVRTSPMQVESQLVLQQ